MTMPSAKIYHRGIGHLHISWDPGLVRLHDAARVLEPGPAHAVAAWNGCTIIPLAAGTGSGEETSLLVGI